MSHSEGFFQLDCSSERVKHS